MNISKKELDKWIDAMRYVSHTMCNGPDGALTEYVGQGMDLVLESLQIFLDYKEKGGEENV